MPSTKRETRRTRRALGSVVALVGLVLASAGCGEGRGLNEYLVEGRITDSFTENGISGARVTFTSDTGFSESTTSGGSGQYSLTVQSDVLFGQVRAERDGYLSNQATVYFDRDERRIDIALVPAPEE